MKKRRYTEEQIIGAIKQHESGVKVEDICRQLNMARFITGAVSLQEWRSRRRNVSENLKARIIS